MRSVLFGLVLLVAAAPALAAPETGTADKPAVAPHRGTILRDANNARLAPIDSVKADGSVGIILSSRYVVIPASTLAVVDGNLITKLTKAQVNDLK